MSLRKAQYHKGFTNPIKKWILDAFFNNFYGEIE